MIALKAKVVLLDIEGTTSSISYVHDVLFPYARAHVKDYLIAHWDEDGVKSAVDALAKDAGKNSFADWMPGATSADACLPTVLAEINSLMDRDAKVTGLKAIQGLIWKTGYEAGELRSHVYDDVPKALERWKQAGVDLRIYSSGSIEAQKQFFGHTEAGNLLPYFSAHYDTTVGGKKIPSSYAAIAKDIGLKAGEILFISDVTGELDAARLTGLQTLLSLRPGNLPPKPNHGFREIHSFDEVDLATA